MGTIQHDVRQLGVLVRGEGVLKPGHYTASSGGRITMTQEGWGFVVVWAQYGSSSSRCCHAPR